jgi:hypothetical protein
VHHEIFNARIACGNAVADEAIIVPDRSTVDYDAAATFDAESATNGGAQEPCWHEIASGDLSGCVASILRLARRLIMFGAHKNNSICAIGNEDSSWLQLKI